MELPTANPLLPADPALSPNPIIAHRSAHKPICQSLLLNPLYSGDSSSPGFNTSKSIVVGKVTAVSSARAPSSFVESTAKFEPLARGTPGLGAHQSPLTPFI